MVVTPGKNWGLNAGAFVLLGALAACSGNVETCPGSAVKSSANCARSDTSLKGMNGGLATGGNGSGGSADIGTNNGSSGSPDIGTSNGSSGSPGIGASNGSGGSAGIGASNGSSGSPDIGANNGSGGSAGIGGSNGSRGSADVDAGPGGDAGGNPAATAEEVMKATGMCGQPEDGAKPVMTKDDLVSMLLGRWLHCPGTALFARDDAAGIRIDADGSWRFLLPGPDGTLVDGKGYDNVGTWNVDDLSAVNGPGAFQFQVDFERPGIGGDGVFPVFATAPSKMRWSTMVGPIDYASLDRD